VTGGNVAALAVKEVGVNRENRPLLTISEMTHDTDTNGFAYLRITTMHAFAETTFAIRAVAKRQCLTPEEVLANSAWYSMAAINLGLVVILRIKVRTVSVFKIIFHSLFLLVQLVGQFNMLAMFKFNQFSLASSRT